MRNRGKGILLRSLCLVFLVSCLPAFAQGQEAPEEMLLDQKAYKTNRRGPVDFSHGDHAQAYELECTDCHHVYKNGKNVWKEGDPVAKCADCHNPSKNEGNVKKLKLAFHDSCKGCHRKLVKEGFSENAPYRKCSDCHERRS